MWLVTGQGCCLVVSVVMVLAVSVALVVVVVGCGVLHCTKAMANAARSNSFFMVLFLGKAFQ